MIPCPSCQQPVEILDKHMGTLFTCPHCNSVYFIDWNGQPELATHEPQEETVLPEVPAQEFSSYESPADVNYEQESPSAETFQTDSYQPDSYQSDAFVAEDEAPAPEVIPPVEEAPYDFSQTLDRVPEALTPSGTSDTPDFSDVTDFANADTAAGPLTYVVVVEGIESSLLLMQLKEAMTDSKFGWNVTELLDQVGGGRLVLKGLSPAKASVLINRIKYLPFKISWRQDVLSGS